MKLNLHKNNPITRHTVIIAIREPKKVYIVQRKETASIVEVKEHWKSMSLPSQFPKDPAPVSCLLASSSFTNTNSATHGNFRKMYLSFIISQFYFENCEESCVIS